MVCSNRENNDRSWRYDMDKLLKPRSVAVIGASEKATPARNAVYNLQEVGFEGDIYPINLKYQEVLGIKCYASLKDLPAIPDSVVISVKAEIVIGYVRQCIELGVPSCVLYTSGFSEIGNTELQQELVITAEKAKLLLCGPNCLGCFNTHTKSGTWSGSIPAEYKAGGIAIVSQSGSMAISFFQQLKELGVNHINGGGNMAVLDIPDYMYYLSNQDEVKVIVLYVEGVNDGRRFLEAAHECRRKGKAVVALKVGRTEKGGRATMAHTASLAGSYDVFMTAFREAGVIVVTDEDEMQQTVTALLKIRPLKGDRVFAVSISGGINAFLADGAEDTKLNLCDLTPETEEKVKAYLPSFNDRVTNPLDGFYDSFLHEIAQDKATDLILIAQDAFKGLGKSTVRHYRELIEEIVKTYRTYDMPLVVYSNHSMPYEEKIMGPLVEADVPYLQGLKESLHAVKQVIEFYNYREDTSICNPKDFNPDWHAIDKIMAKYSAGEQIGEKDGKMIVHELGIPIPQQEICTSEAEVRAAAKRHSLPLVMKIESPDIAHKTDVGGVLLNLRSEDEIADAFIEMMTGVRVNMPQARLEGVLLQEMVQDGVDMIVGVNNDSNFGHVMVYGLGGIYVEVIKSSTLGLIPLTYNKAKSMIEKSNSYPLMKEFRGRAALDTNQMIDAMLRLSLFVERYQDRIASIDMNPVRIGTFGVKVLDTLIVLK